MIPGRLPTKPRQLCSASRKRTYLSNVVSCMRAWPPAVALARKRTTISGEEDCDMQ